MDNNEIKKANRKALPKFILIMVLSLIIGGGFQKGLLKIGQRLYNIIDRIG